MYANTGYLTGEDIDIENYEVPLLVTSCGYYRLLQRKVMTTTRPRGRNDYQLLYVASGKAYFNYYEAQDCRNQIAQAGPLATESLADSRPQTIPTNNQLLTVSAGSLVLYRPGQMQLYTYLLEDSPEIYWVHFTGRDADKILDEIGFQYTSVLSCDVSGDYPELFSQIIRELQLKRPCFEDLLPLYLRQLFWRIKRSRLETDSDRLRPSPEIENAIHYFNESFSQEISIEDYAAGQHISISWFIRSFKHYTGIPPLQYITLLRINKAKELLQATNFSIQEIGKIVGYEDSLYFSRIFKKQTGHAPTWFRKKRG